MSFDDSDLRQCESGGKCLNAFTVGNMLKTMSFPIVPSPMAILASRTGGSAKPKYVFAIYGYINA